MYPCPVCWIVPELLASTTPAPHEPNPVAVITGEPSANRWVHAPELVFASGGASSSWLNATVMVCPAACTRPAKSARQSLNPRFSGEVCEASTPHTPSLPAAISPLFVIVPPPVAETLSVNPLIGLKVVTVNCPAVAVGAAHTPTT